jgi:hypothetical protein
MSPADESAASAPNPPFASGQDRRTTQPTLHTARLNINVRNAATTAGPSTKPVIVTQSGVASISP